MAQEFHKSDTAVTNLTAGGGATTLATSTDTQDISAGAQDAATVDVVAKYENTSLTTAAVVTTTLEKSIDGGSWTTVTTRTSNLRGLVGLLAKDRDVVVIFTLSRYNGADHGVMKFRVTASCTGANVDVLACTLRVVAPGDDMS